MFLITKQHYVPQFYLKNFSSRKTVKGKKHYSINCFDKELGTNYVAKIKNIAQEKFFYEETGRSLEKEISEIESACSKVLKDLISSKNEKLLEVDKERSIISLFLALQFIRTKEVREMIKESVSEIKTFLYEDREKLPESWINQLEQNNEDYGKLLHINHFKHILEYSEMFFSKKWCFIINSTESSFWTSDNPLVKFNPLNFGYTGIQSKGIKLFFPLTSKIGLCLLDPEYYKSITQFQKIKSSNINHNILEVEKYHMKLDIEVNFHNSLQAKQSTRHVFSKDGDFYRAEKWIKSNKIKSNRIISNKLGNDTLFIKNNL